jgi:hypothetical protein
MHTGASTTRGIARALLLAGIAACPTLAQAQTYHSASGNICQSVYPYSSSGLGSGLFHENTGLRNSSSVFQFVWCPLTRTNALGTSGFSEVYVDVNDSTASLWCAVESNDYFGNTTSLTSFVTTPNPGSGEIAFYNVPTTAWGYVQVFCAMPKNSVIHTINWVES